MPRPRPRSISLNSLAAGLWLLLSVFGCDLDWQDRGESSPVGMGLVERETGGIVALPSVVADSSSSYSPPRGSLSYLLVGTSAGRTAAALIRFSSLPDTLQIEEARLVLGLYACDWAERSQQISVKQVESSWTEDVELAVLPAVIEDAGTTITVDDTMSLGHRLETTLPPTWVSGRTELALLLEPIQGTGSCAFGASELGAGPVLELQYTQNDSVKVGAVDDTYHLTRPSKAEGLLIGGAEPSRVLVWFDPGKLKGSLDTTVVAATLEAPRLSPLPGTTMELAVYEDGEEPKEAGTVTVGESGTTVSIALSREVVLQIRSWVERPPASDYGLVLQSHVEGRSMGWLEIGPPVLTLVYSISPTME